jgi:hypothetical protein
VIWIKAKSLAWLTLCLVLSMSEFCTAGQSWGYKIDGTPTSSMTEDGKCILVGSSSGIYYLFNEFGEVIGQEDLGSEITSLDTNGKSIIVGTKSATFILRLEGRKILQTASDPVLAVAISADNSYAISGTEQNVLRFPSLTYLGQLYVGAPVEHVCLSSDGKKAAAATSAQVLFFDNDADTYVSYDISMTTCMEFFGGESLVVGTKTGLLYLITDTGESVLYDSGESIVSVHTNHDTILAGTSSGGIHLFHVKEGERVDFSIDGLVDCDISSDGRFILAANSRKVYFCRENGKILWTRDIDHPRSTELSDSGKYETVTTEEGIFFFCNWEKTFEGDNHYPYASRERYSFENFKKIWDYPVTAIDGPYIYQSSMLFDVGDVNGDGKNEIVTSVGKGFAILDSEGTLISLRTCDHEVYYLHLLDVDGDTIPEITYAVKDGKYRILVMDARKGESAEAEVFDFTSYFGVEYRDAEDASIEPVVSYDIDDDGKNEILATVATGYALNPRGILAFEYPSGKPEWFYRSAPNVAIDAFTDIDQDGSPEIILGSHSCCNGNTEGQRDDCHIYLTVLNVEGKEIWSQEIGEEFKELRTGVGDINNDGNLEIVGTVDDAMNVYGRLFVMDYKGALLYGEDFEYSVWLGGIVDFNDDKFLEVVTTDSEGYLTVSNFEMEPVNTYKVGGYIQSAVRGVADLDGDGSEEIVVQTWDNRVILLSSDLEEKWSKKFKSSLMVSVTNVSGCANDVLIFGEEALELYSFEGEGMYLCSGLIGPSSIPEPGSRATPTPTEKPGPFTSYDWMPVLVIVIISFFAMGIFSGRLFHLRTRKDIQDLMVLSLEKRSEREYQISLESVHRTIPPVQSFKTIDISPEMRSEIIGRIDCASKVINTFLASGKKLEKTVDELTKMGTVLYKNFIPQDFAPQLVYHYLVLEVEDVQIPWELMYSEDFFALKYAISRRIKSEKVPVVLQTPKRRRKALIIADPTDTLPEAVRECEYLAECLQGYFTVTYLKPEKARKVDVMYHFSQGYDIIHYAGELGENTVLPVYEDSMTCEEIERTLEGSPVVFLNGCGSARTFSHNIEGLAKVFLEKGALSFIGSLWSIHDRTAAEIAGEFYRNCFRYPVGEALRLTRAKYYSSGDITWAAFVMYGDPTLNLYR